MMMSRRAILKVVASLTVAFGDGEAGDAGQRLGGRGIALALEVGVGEEGCDFGGFLQRLGNEFAENDDALCAAIGGFALGGVGGISLLGHRMGCDHGRGGDEKCAEGSAWVLHGLSQPRWRERFKKGGGGGNPPPRIVGEGL